MRTSQTLDKVFDKVRDKVQDKVFSLFTLQTSPPMQADTFQKLDNAFHEKYIKGGNYDIVLVGDKNKLNFTALKAYGPVKELSLQDVFGY